MRQSRGRANQGKPWEATLEHWHSLYAAKGWAWVIRTPPPVKIIGRVVKGQFRACFEGGGPPDYAGAVRGVPVVFDAKSTAQARWSLAEVKPHQAAHLDNASDCGAFAFIALQHPSGSWVLPWELLRLRWHAWHAIRLAKAITGPAKPGTASLDAADIEEIGLRFTDRGWIDHVPKGEASAKGPHSR